MKIYVIVVTYNGNKYIENCLNSLYTRDMDLNVIIVDNNSQDNTVEIIKSKFKEVVLLKQTRNLGFGKANNIGISFALENNAEFVFLLNQDAKMNADTINTLVNVSLQNPSYGIISPLHLDKSNAKLESVFLYFLNKKKELFSDLLLKHQVKDLYDYNMVNAAAWLIPKNTFIKVGGFHPMFFLYGEDDNFCQRVLYHGFKIGVCPHVSISHDSGINYHQSPEVGSKEYYEKYLNQLKVKYGNVNSEDYRDFHKVKVGLLKESIKTLIKLQPKKSQVAFHKFKLVKKLDFRQEIKINRKINNSFLD